MKLDRNKPFGTVTGHKTARFEQNGLLYNIRGELIDPLKPPPVQLQQDLIIETDAVDSARRFLVHVLQGGPMSKSVLYKVVEENNQSWDAVTKAASLLGIVKFAYNKATMWKLPEDVGVL